MHSRTSQNNFPWHCPAVLKVKSKLTLLMLLVNQSAELRETKIKKELKKAAKKAPAEEVRELAGR